MVKPIAQQGTNQFGTKLFDGPSANDIGNDIRRHRRIERGQRCHRSRFGIVGYQIVIRQDRFGLRFWIVQYQLYFFLCRFHFRFGLGFRFGLRFGFGLRLGFRLGFRLGLRFRLGFVNALGQLENTLTLGFVGNRCLFWFDSIRFRGSLWRGFASSPSDEIIRRIDDRISSIEGS